MNLPPAWVPALTNRGWNAQHWYTLGPPNASDIEIMQYARTHQYVIFTHDLDFGTMLALTHAHGPSVLQIRGSNITPESMINIVDSALQQHAIDLENGALVVVNEATRRVRLLPF
ncbi:MAG: DUF5615 family PIN-like protein [Algisphaera sp.]